MFSAVAAVLLSLGYLLPTAIAYYREHRNTTAITVLNLFLGWTLVGWVAALVWALVDRAAMPVAVVSTQGAVPEAHRLPCPFCAELVLPAAKLCRFCGHELAPDRSRPAAPARGVRAAPITSWRMPPPELRH